MSTKTNTSKKDTATAGAAPTAAGHGHAEASSSSKSTDSPSAELQRRPEPGATLTELPEFIIDALEVPEAYPPSFSEPGDMIAGALIRVGTRQIPRISGEGDRTVHVAMLYGINLYAAGSFSKPAYFELIGYSTVLEKHLARLYTCELGTLVRIEYRGRFASQTAGYNDYSDYTMTVGRTLRPDELSTGVLTDAPDWPATAPELEGEPF